jgi:hypothetical protein
MMTTWVTILKVILFLGIPTGYAVYKFAKKSTRNRLIYNEENNTAPELAGATTKRNTLLEKIKISGFPKNEVFVSIEDFFDGNADEGSIGVNIYPNPPSLKTFYNTLKRVEKSAQTENVLVRIADIDDTEWFYTDTVYISGRYSLDEVREIFKPIKPDEIYEGMIYSKTSNIPQLNIGCKGYCVWWD